MSYFLFTEKIIKGEPIDVFNDGHHARDFTYIDDIVESVARASDRVAAPNPDWSGDAPDPGTSLAPYRLYNIGNHAPVQLMDYIACIERTVGKTAKKNFLPLQAGRRTGDLRRRRRPQGRYRLRAENFYRGRRETFRRVVSGLLSGLAAKRRAARTGAL